MDLAVLVRSALRYAQTGDSPPSARVSLGDGWPSLTHWDRTGMLALGDGGESVVVSPEPWRPRWLDGSDNVEPALAAAQWRTRREPPGQDLPADPFFRAGVGHGSYSAPSQREAVRALALAPDGGNVVANLPTGTGKSAVAYAIASLRASRGPAVAVVVVPTTALALDQERAFQEIAAGTDRGAPPALAYHGGLVPDAKADIRRRVREGSQTIVFTSPESLLGGLRSAVFDAADQGLISLFGIDEAHVAVAWGEGFRPEFQFMAPLRDELLERQRAARGDGFATLLMSGTLTAAALDRLARDFGTSGPVEVVSGAVLRPEPEYWIADSTSESDRVARVLEALAVLPRPAILYTTRPRDADEWRQRLEFHGYRRLAVVHGGTSEGDRRRAMAGVRGLALAGGPPATTIDLIIGTSAYGLGVDQPDVRAVIHACLPESLDRFYQEVGRGGRDGNASVSVLIPARGDHRIAEALATDAVISVDKARERWTAMSAVSEPTQSGGRRLHLREVPSYLFRDNDTSAAWNLRTLLLLQQSGALRIRVERPPQRAPGESDEAWDLRAEGEWERQRMTRVVDLLKVLDDEQSWRVVEDAREHAKTRGRSGFVAMNRAMAPDASLCAAFAAEYSVARGDVPALPQLRIRVSRACGGCPGCRAEGLGSRAGVRPDPGPSRVHDPLRPSIARLLDVPDRALCVLVEDLTSGKTTRRVRSALRQLAGVGASVFVAPAETLRAIRADLERRPVITATTWDPTALPDISSVVLALHPYVAIDLDDALRSGPPRFVLVDGGAADPFWPSQTLSSRPNALSLETFLSILEGLR